MGAGTRVRQGNRGSAAVQCTAKHQTQHPTGCAGCALQQQASSGDGSPLPTNLATATALSPWTSRTSMPKSQCSSGTEHESSTSCSVGACDRASDPCSSTGTGAAGGSCAAEVTAATGAAGACCCSSSCRFSSTRAAYASRPSAGSCGLDGWEAGWEAAVPVGSRCSTTTTSCSRTAGTAGAAGWMGCEGLPARAAGKCIAAAPPPCGPGVLGRACCTGGPAGGASAGGTLTRLHMCPVVDRRSRPARQWRGLTRLMTHTHRHRVGVSHRLPLERVQGFRAQGPIAHPPGMHTHAFPVTLCRSAYCHRTRSAAATRKGWLGGEDAQAARSCWPVRRVRTRLLASPATLTSSLEHCWQNRSALPPASNTKGALACSSAGRRAREGVVTGGKHTRPYVGTHGSWASPKGKASLLAGRSSCWTAAASGQLGSMLEWLLHCCRPKHVEVGGTVSGSGAAPGAYRTHVRA